MNICENILQNINYYTHRNKKIKNKTWDMEARHK